MSYGCMRISGTWNPAEVTAEHRKAGKAALLAAYEAGYTLFDHADIYGQGSCESIHGELLAEMPDLREGTVIATKCGIRFGGDPKPDSPHRYDFSKEHILWSCDQSLRRLGIETIDIYQLHRPDLLMNPDEIGEAFEKLHAAGKVRYFGVSNFAPSFVETLQKGLGSKLTVNQVEIHLGRLACFYDGTLDQCLRERIVPLSWSPLGGGWLGDGGTVSEDDPKAEGKRKLLAVLDATAKEHGVTRSVVSLAWLMKHPAGIVPIVGSTKPDRIRDMMGADTLDLSREEWYRILVAARMEPLP